MNLMLAFGNGLMLLLAAVNLYGVLAGKGFAVRDIASQMRAMGSGLSHLRAALAASALAHLYLIGLTLPLKAINYYLGLGWAVLMLLATLESVYTGRALIEAVEGEAEPHLPFHDSWGYRAYQVVFNALIIMGCTLLLLAPHE